MRILYVVHQFVPRHIAGTELYTDTLARAMTARGHEVAIFSTEAYHGVPHSTMQGKTHNGLRVFEAVHNNSFSDFENSYIDPEKEAQFRDVLRSYGPDVVHFQHLHQHSIRNISIAKDLGLPVAYTLHEFWLLCVHHGWLAKPGYELCSGPNAEECARCAMTCMPRPRAGDAFEDWRSAWLERERVLRAELDRVDLFVSPSRFLRERFLDAGWIPPERIEFSDNGMPAHARAGPARTASDSLRVGFVGTVAEWKGVHVLIDAVNALEGEAIQLDIHGELAYFPEYVARLRSEAQHPEIRFHGRFENREVAKVLSEIDVLVVPSLWYENSPLTIHEAFLAGVPVLASDIGGMAEFVEHERNGLHFEVGNARSLEASLRRLLADTTLLDQLRAGIPEFKTASEDAEAWEGRYSRLLDRA